MIYTRDYDEMLRNVASEFFVSAIQYVSDLRSWSGQKGIGLSEPSQPMKLFTEGKRLMMFVQPGIEDRALDDTIRALSVRWALKDNVTDPSVSLNTVKKRLAYCFLKEYARTVTKLAGDELLEDQWAIREMERLGFFRE